MDTSDISRDDNHEYYEKDGVQYPPVSTVTSYLDVDMTGLNKWQAKHDGSGDGAYHEHLFWYSRHRGTITHYQCLNPLADGELVSADERQSIRQILCGPDAEETDEWDEDTPTSLSAIVYSVMKHHNHDYINSRDEYQHDTELFSILEDDYEWANNEFDTLQDELGINPIAVEQYLVHEDYKYGGQCDLLYEDPNGNVVLADLKTSSGIREKYLLQTAAYKRAIEDTDGLPDTVDRCEIIRLNADKHDVQVHGSVYPEYVDDDADYYETYQFYTSYYGDYDYDNMNEMWAQYRELLKQCHGNITAVEDIDYDISVDTNGDGSA